MLLAGCLVPLSVPENPHVAGRVLDAETTRPIPGATLQFEHFQEQPVVTTADGRFDIPILSRVKVVLMPADLTGYGHTDYLLVNAPRYQPERLRYASYRSYGHETIFLKRRNHLTSR